MAKLLAGTICFLIIATVAAEVFLRTRYGGGHPVLLKPDPSCGYYFKPDQTLVRMGGNHVHINHFGMRAEDIAASRPEGTERVLFLGDSVTYGTTHVDQAKTFTGILQDWLPAHERRPVQVLNASASAWAISNEWGYLKSRGTFGADQLVLVLNSGDLNQGWSDIHDLGDVVYQKNPLAIREAFNALILPKLLGPKMDKGAFVEPDRPEIARRNLEFLDQIRAFAQASHAHLSIIFIPHRTSIQTNQQFSAQKPLVDWAKTHSVPLLDVTATLSPLPWNAITMEGVHLNAQGNAIVAQTVEQHWEQLTSGAPPETHVGP